MSSPFKPDEGCEEGCYPLCLCGLAGDPVAKEIVRRVRDRLILGHRLHGPFPLRGKDWNREKREELLDYLVYDTAEALEKELGA